VSLLAGADAERLETRPRRSMQNRLAVLQQRQAASRRTSLLGGGSPVDRNAGGSPHIFHNTHAAGSSWPHPAQLDCIRQPGMQQHQPEVSAAERTPQMPGPGRQTSRQAPQMRLQPEQYLGRGLPTTQDMPQSVQPTQILHSAAQQSQLQHGHAAAVCRASSKLQDAHSIGSVHALQRPNAELLQVHTPPASTRTMHAVPHMRPCSKCRQPRTVLHHEHITTLIPGRVFYL
jgi:hypothetical protein